MKNKTKKNKGGKVGGATNWWRFSETPTTVASDKVWKFTLDPWVKLPDINKFLGSTFIISQIDIQRKDTQGAYKYDIYIAPIGSDVVDPNLYPSVMDVCRQNKPKWCGTKKPKAKKKPSKKSKS